MKTKTQHLLIALTVVASLHRPAATLAAGSTTFTYQGRLTTATGIGANGSYDLIFTLFNASTDGSPVGGPITNGFITLSDLSAFTTPLDFGFDVFNGTNTNWLEIGVRTNGGGAFTTLSPRQPITGTPQSIYAVNAGTAAIAMAATNFSGVVAGDVAGPQGATVVATVGGQTAANVASGAVLANSATSINTPNTLVKRDGNGDIASGSVTLDGSLYLPYPAIIYSGSNTMFIESGSLYVGTGAGAADFARATYPFPDLLNVGVGDGALNHNNVGMFNTAVGEGALQFNTTGSRNKADGYQALFSNTEGSDNTAIGYQALFANTTASENTAVGGSALHNNITGTGNTASGFFALVRNTDGYNNTANGWWALAYNTSGWWNTALGSQALESNTTGHENTAGGMKALISNTTGSQNTAFGDGALALNQTGSRNTGTGLEALYSNTAGDNTANGYHALFSNTSGYRNTAIGSEALFFNTTGYSNTANGVQALYNNTMGYWNTATGDGALFANTSGFDNTANGRFSLNRNTTGIYNTANGGQALYSNTTGDYNTGIGANALWNETSGYNNTANGMGALFNLSSGHDNIAVGYVAGNSLTTENNNIDIGNVGATGDSGTIRIGTAVTHVSTFVAGIWNTTPLGASVQTVVVDSNGQLGTGGGSVPGVTSVTGSGHITATPTTGDVVVGSDATPLDTFGTIVSRDNNGSFNANNIALGSAVNCPSQNGVLNLPTTTANAGMITLGSCDNYFLHAFGQHNFFGGLYAGNFLMGGCCNVGVGYFALHSNTCNSDSGGGASKTA